MAYYESDIIFGVPIHKKHELWDFFNIKITFGQDFNEISDSCLEDMEEKIEKIQNPYITFNCEYGDENIQDPILLFNASKFLKTKKEPLSSFRDEDCWQKVNVEFFQEKNIKLMKEEFMSFVKQNELPIKEEEIGWFGNTRFC